MIKKLSATALIFSAIVFTAQAQNVGINNTDPKTTLDVKGGLATRAVTLTPFANAVSIPDNSSFVEVGPGTAAVTCIAPGFIDGKRLVILNRGGYDNIFNGIIIPPNQSREFICRNPGGWTLLSGATANESWSLKGNSGTDTSMNFIGTTDNNDFSIKTNNTRAVTITKDGMVGVKTSTPNASMDINGGFRLQSVNVTVTGTSALLTSNQSHHVLIGSPTADFNIAYIGPTMEGQHAIITNTTLFKGFLVPVYIQPNTTVELIYSNGAWKLIGTNEPTTNIAWGLNGNNNVTGSNFIGTVNDAPLLFKVNNDQAGGIGRYGNVALGNVRNNDFFNDIVTAGSTQNTAIGNAALKNYAVMYGNTAVGFASSENNLGGIFNTAVGHSALNNNKSGNYAVAIGKDALRNDTSAHQIVAIGNKALYWNNNKFGNTAVGANSLFNNSNPDLGVLTATEGLNNTALGHSALFNSRRGSNNVAVGYEAGYKNVNPIGIVAIGNKALYKDDYGPNSIAIGNEAASKAIRSRGTIAIGYHAFDSTAPNTPAYVNWDNVAIGTGSMSLHSVNTENVAIGYATLTQNVNGNQNVVVGAQALQLQSSGNFNVAIGAHTLLANSAGDGNVAIGFGSFQSLGIGSNNVGIGYNAGYFETGSNKLYIENSNANKDNALIYGDFAADSLLLNAKTVVRNNAVVKGFTKLGGYGADVPSIKTKKITGTGPAVNGNLAVAHGLDASKIISVQIFMQYGAAPTPTKVLPPGYTLIAGYEYQFEIDGANILITNKGANSANIGNKPFRMLITYEE